MTRLERNRLHTTSRDFFDMHGRTLMKLNVDAAIEVCLRAAAHGLVVARVEGGIWHRGTADSYRVRGHGATHLGKASQVICWSGRLS